MRSFKAICLLLLSAAVVLPANAQRWPNRPVRIIIPYAAGGGADGVARLLSQDLTQAFKESFVVDPKPGGNTTIAAVAVAHAPADGYTLLLTGNAATTLNPLLMEHMPYDPDKDFVPVTMITHSPFLVVASSELGVNSLAELLAQARAKPGVIAYASNGTGGIVHLGMELLGHDAGVRFNHVPYKGFAPALPDLLSGRTPLSMFDLGSLGAFAKSDKIRILASTSAERSKLFPDVPTVAELGFPGFQVESWFTLYAPASTPPAIIALLNREIVRWAALPETARALSIIGQEPESSTAEYVRARTHRERLTYAPLIKAANIKFE